MKIIREIPLGQIIMDHLPINFITFQYAEFLKDGSIFPPIKVARMRDGRYKILDGRHRILAHKLNNKKLIKAKFSREFYQK